MGSVRGVGGQSQAMGWIVTGLVVVLAALTFVIVRSTAQPEPPDLTPVEVTPHSSSAPPHPSTTPPQSPGPGGEPTGADSSVGSDSQGSADAEGTPPRRIERSYEPAPNPPREIPDGDDDDDDVGDGEEVEDAGDDDDD